MLSPRPLRSLAAALLGTAAALALLPASSQAVVGGTSVGADGDYPWTVAIVARGVNAFDGQFCGGTLISPTRVLTAAHCIDPTGPYQALPGDIDVVIGQTSLTATGTNGYQRGERIAVADVSLHAHTAVADFRYDVAQLTLARPVSAALEGAIVAPVSPSGESVADTTDKAVASTTPDAWGVGTEARVFGWGVKAFGSTAYNPLLAFAGGPNMVRLSDQTCAARNGTDFRPEDMLCVGVPTIGSTTPTPSPDACQGDSGGPLLKQARFSSAVLSPEALAARKAAALLGLDPDVRAGWTATEVATWQAELRADPLHNWEAEQIELNRQATLTNPTPDDLAVQAAERQRLETQDPPPVPALTEQEIADQSRAVMEQGINDRYDAEAAALPNLTSTERDDRYGAAVTARIADLVAQARADTQDARIDAVVQARVDAEVDVAYQAEVSAQNAAQLTAYRHEGRQWRLMGVVSWGDGCGDPGHPGVYARVGAPAISEYVNDPSPVPMPTLDGSELPTLRGSYALGSTITCTPGRWRGNPQSYDFTLWRDGNQDGIRSRDGSEKTIVNSGGVHPVSLSDLTSPYPVGCSVTARGAGGYSSANAATFTDLTVMLPPTTDVTKQPEVTPTVQAVDTLGPILARRSVVCGASSCRVSVIVLDRGTPLAGIKLVTAAFTRSRKGTCKVKRGKDAGERRPCTIKSKRTLTLKRSGTDVWTVTVKGIRKTDRTALRVRAVDTVGNVAPSTLPITLKLPTRR